MTSRLERWSGLILAYGSLFIALYGMATVGFGVIYVSPLAIVGGLLMTIPYLAYRTRKAGTTTIPYQHKLT